MVPFCFTGIICVTAGFIRDVAVAAHNLGFHRVIAICHAFANSDGLLLSVTRLVFIENRSPFTAIMRLACRNIEPNIHAHAGSFVCAAITVRIFTQGHALALRCIVRSFFLNRGLSLLLYLSH